jgi:hypothetical protein
VSAERQPIWPVRRYPERDDAIAAAMVDLDAGDEVIVHQAACAARWDEPCTCTPEVQVVMRGQA